MWGKRSGVTGDRFLSNLLLRDYYMLNQLVKLSISRDLECHSENIETTVLVSVK